MKTVLFTLLGLAALSLVGCTTVTAPDGTVTESVDAESVRLITEAVVILKSGK